MPTDLELHFSAYVALVHLIAAYAVPRSSLHARLVGCQTHATAYQHQPRLTRGPKDFLVQWILDEDSCAQPPTHARVREMATRILHINRDFQPLSNEWISQFLSRQKRVSSIVGPSIEAPRAEAASPDIIRVPQLYRSKQQVKKAFNCSPSTA